MPAPLTFVALHGLDKHGQTPMDVSQDDAHGPSRFSALLRDLARVPSVSWPDLGSALVPGARIGRFETVRQIGRGGFGVVLEARDPVLDRSVAVKVVRPVASCNRGGTPRLVEAEAIARLSHPNIVQLYDAGMSELGPYLVFELLRGETLLERLRCGPISRSETVRIGLEVARGLAHAHESGIVHRDLKPGNVFLCSDGRVKILDFGLALVVGRARKLEGGTPGWMAPEQRRGAPEDERTDVWALGALLYHAVTGQVPSCSPLQPREELAADPGLAAVLDHMLQSDPVARPRDGSVVVEALQGIASPTPGLETVRRHGTHSESGRPARWRERRGLALGAAALVALGGAATLARTFRSVNPAVPPERPVTLLVAPFHPADESVRSEAGMIHSLVVRGAEKYLRPGQSVRVLTDDLPAPRTESEARRRAEGTGADLVLWATVASAAGSAIASPALTTSAAWELPRSAEDLETIRIDSRGAASIERTRQDADHLAHLGAEVIASRLAQVSRASALALLLKLEPSDEASEEWLDFIQREHIRAVLRETSRVPQLTWGDAVRFARAHLALAQPDLALETLARTADHDDDYVELLRCYALTAAARFPGGRDPSLPEIVGSASRLASLPPPDADWGALAAFVCRASADVPNAADALRARLPSFEAPWPAAAARWLLGEISESALLDFEKQPWSSAGRRCEVRYYAGVGHLLRGTSEGAVAAAAHFREAVATRATNDREYDLALLELRRLERERRGR